MNMWRFREGEETTFCLPACTAEDQKICNYYALGKIRKCKLFPKGDWRIIIMVIIT